VSCVFCVRVNTVVFCRVWLGLCVHVTGGLLWTKQLATGDHWKDTEILRPMLLAGYGW
jgi:hypothetical protein